MKKTKHRAIDFEWKWKVIRKEGITIAQGWQCPKCKLINKIKSCVRCGEQTE